MIKKVIYKAKLNDLNFVIVQTYYLKGKLEEISVSNDEVNIASIDAVNIYLSIKLAAIKKLVRYFTT